MRRRDAISALAVGTFASAAVAAPVPKDAGDARLEWVEACLKEIRAIKKGMTRGDVLKKFKQSGGRYSRRLTAYQYLGCEYFKISVTFEPDGPGEKLSPGDKVLTVSTPYLECPRAE